MPNGLEVVCGTGKSQAFAGPLRGMRCGMRAYVSEWLFEKMNFTVWRMNACV